MSDRRSWRLRFRRHRRAVVTAVSGVLFAGGWGVALATPYEVASAAMLITGAVVGGYDVAKKASYALRSGTVGINTLVTLAAVGAIAIGEYWEAAGIVFLFSLGSYLEARTMGKTRSALTELLELAPETAIVRRDGDEREVPAREVEPGEIVIVKPGGKLPVDGTVLEGETTVDQAPVTGESAPVHKTAGDEVYAGTINQTGALEIRATGTGSETTIQRIIRRVEHAQEAKAPTETIIERFAKYYTPGIVVLAAGTYLVTGNVIVTLTLLVIGCPGALVIGPPVSIVSAIGNAARNGVLLKGGEHLERAGTIDVVAFDKTGTLTSGAPSVATVEGVEADADETLRLGAIAEKRSEHHLADAILEAARDPAGFGTTATDGGHVVHRPSPQIPDPDAFDVVAGKGVLARYDGQELLVGNRALLEEREVSVPAAVASIVREREAAGETAVHVVRDGVVVGVIGIRDELREAATDVVDALAEAGVRSVMLTGDNERVARAEAEQVGIEDHRASLFPEEKQDAIAAVQAEGNVVAMVGDGINDAPALATADVGIAMGAAGTDTAIETADIALMADDLERIPYAVTLSKATRHNVFQNIGIAILTVALLLAGVFAGFVHMTTGMLGHIASVLIVIANGMRLLRH